MKSPSNLLTLPYFVGGIITKADLQNYKPRWTNPVSIHLDNGNYTIYTPPPPSSGIIVEMILKILDSEYNISFNIYYILEQMKWCMIM